MAPEFPTGLRRRWTRRTFERHTRGFLPQMYRAAKRLVRHEADAQDLVHETYLKAFRAIGAADLRSESDCRAWLNRIMINQFRDTCRRRRRAAEADMVLRFDDGDERNIVELLPCAEPGPDRIVEGRQLIAAADAAMAELAEDDRIVVTLFLVQELSYAAIAEIVGCPLGTVMSRLARGRRKLKAALNESAGCEPPVTQAASG